MTLTIKKLILFESTLEFVTICDRVGALAHHLVVPPLACR